MRKLILLMAITLDGVVAPANGTGVVESGFDTSRINAVCVALSAKACGSGIASDENVDGGKPSGVDKVNRRACAINGDPTL